MLLLYAISEYFQFLHLGFQIESRLSSIKDIQLRAMISLPLNGFIDETPEAFRRLQLLKAIETGSSTFVRSRGSGVDRTGAKAIQVA